MKSSISRLVSCNQTLGHGEAEQAGEPEPLVQPHPVHSHVVATAEESQVTFRLLNQIVTQLHVQTFSKEICL